MIDGSAQNSDKPPNGSASTLSAGGRDRSAQASASTCREGHPWKRSFTATEPFPSKSAAGRARLAELPEPHVRISEEIATATDPIAILTGRELHLMTPRCEIQSPASQSLPIRNRPELSKPVGAGTLTPRHSVKIALRNAVFLGLSDRHALPPWQTFRRNALYCELAHDCCVM